MAFRRAKWAAGRRTGCRPVTLHSSRKTITFVGSLTLKGFFASALLDGQVRGECFPAWVEQMHVPPTLLRGHLVVIQTRPAHKIGGIKKAIEARNVRCLTFLLKVPTSNRSRTSVPSPGPIPDKLPSVSSRRSKPLQTPGRAYDARQCINFFAQAGRGRD